MSEKNSNAAKRQNSAWCVGPNSLLLHLIDDPGSENEDSTINQPLVENWFGTLAITNARTGLVSKSCKEGRAQVIPVSDRRGTAEQLKASVDRQSQSTLETEEKRGRQSIEIVNVCERMLLYFEIATISKFLQLHQGVAYTITIQMNKGDRMYKVLLVDEDYRRVKINLWPLNMEVAVAAEDADQALDYVREHQM